MERMQTPWRPDSETHYSRGIEEDQIRCGECGEEFHKPLLAKLSSQGLVQTYYACPRCLTEVPERRMHESQRSEPSFSLGEVKKPSVKLEANANCGHFFGYLKQRPKDTAIPEDCLTCERMIECMVH